MTQITLEQVLEQIAEKGISYGVLSSPLSKQVGSITKITIRALFIKGRQMYQLSEQVGSKALHRNVTDVECIEVIKMGLRQDFKQGLFCMDGLEYHILVSKKKQITILTKKSSQRVQQIDSKACSTHNRKKNYILEEGVPVGFLVEQGIMTSQGNVISKKYDKFRQINRFLEMVSDILPFLPQGRCINIVDFGCGKAYLTFALYYYLHYIKKREVSMIGLDLKEDVIEGCQDLAIRLRYDSLTFIVADINRYECSGKVDLMVALHACDTATDAALEKGIRWEADVILCAPCCQHELFRQVSSKPLESLLRYGILKERFAALATDAARAELLTVLGYDVQILEFIDMEHTPKNLLIRAVKNHKKPSHDAFERYHRFKKALSINPCLERLLVNFKR